MLKKRGSAMIGPQFRRVIIWLGAALFLLACALPLLTTPTQAPQALVPRLLGTPIAQTAAAAKTQTVVNLPPSLTPTLTPFPTGTKIVVSSVPTFFFALPTLTPVPTWTSPAGLIIQGSGGSGNNNSDSPFTGKEWTCIVTATSPRKEALIEAGVNFYAYFTVMNTGTKTWPNNGVDFIYTGGYRLEGGKIHDLPKTTPTGAKVTIKALYVSPTIPGVYNSFWTLKVGRYSFCEMKISFEVK
jgi:hypothetical protein